MEEAGWELSEYFNRFAAVFDEPEYGMVDDDDELLACVNSAYGRVTFAWGEDGKEDAARVQPVIAELGRRIQDKLERETADLLRKTTE